MSSDVIDFVQKRKESIEKKRRNFERVMFENFLGCYSVIDNDESLSPIEIIDISHKGLLIQVSSHSKNKRKFEKNKDIFLRLYFTKDSYLPIIVKIKHGASHIDERGDFFIRYGCEFDRDSNTFEALETFINFIYKFAEHSSLDSGQNKVHFLP